MTSFISSDNDDDVVVVIILFLQYNIGTLDSCCWFQSHLETLSDGRRTTRIISRCLPPFDDPLVVVVVCCWVDNGELDYAVKMLSMFCSLFDLSRKIRRRQARLDSFAPGGFGWRETSKLESDEKRKTQIDNGPCGVVCCSYEKEHCDGTVNRINADNTTATT